MIPDYAHALQLLEDSQKEFLDLLTDLSEEQWTFKPGSEVWSIAETAEHIVRGEGLLFEALQSALNAPPDPEWEAKTGGKTHFVERALLGRKHKARAPESIVPRSAWTKEETIARFQKRRAKTIEFVTKAEHPLDGHTYEHPFPVFNTLNAYQWLIYIPLHSSRHLLQIKEIMASAGFPASALSEGA